MIIHHFHRESRTPIAATNIVNHHPRVYRKRIAIILRPLREQSGFPPKMTTVIIPYTHYKMEMRSTTGENDGLSNLKRGIIWVNDLLSAVTPWQAITIATYHQLSAAGPVVGCNAGRRPINIPHGDASAVSCPHIIYAQYLSNSYTEKGEK